ncbi:MULTISPECIES: hypothetical protein [unclassified Rhodococcus (in: high G+C Gram-positive bacteria)]|uniref:hypothetical protein n=1 Tax=unclassified Rhodococcus (in: high G+C Gram-positive bacteria) TaxID=192944 RepID=UPI0006F91060|nr:MULTISPECIES: hypothetical protein [unclassified Rhodococcus (in: high G+C Gram-positive bacteria)]KQU30353.1 hypothetical protein ASG69_04665 [Rhodococcus sp. Leaf225]KQU44742.1 hypothetical protein ASH03_12475 [Rhodococcus sp. Leaf258]
MSLASTTILFADPVLTTENVGVATALIVAIAGGIATVLGAKSKSKLDALAQVMKERDEAREERDEEKRLRVSDRTDLRAEHDVEIQRLNRRVAMLEAQVDERDAELNTADRLVLACRRYITKLVAALIERGGSVPERPSELDT